MNRRPDLSLIVSVYNQGPWASLVLSSIARQRCNATFEVILSDDGSTDDLLATVRSHATPEGTDLRYVWQPHSGFRLARSRNNAIRLARGRILVFVDGDTWLSPDFLSMHYEAHVDDRTLVCGARYTLAVSNASAVAAHDTDVLSHFAGRVHAEYLAQCKWIQSSRPWMACLGGNFSVSAGSGLLFDEAFESWGSEDRDFAYRAYERGMRPQLLPRANAVHLTLAETRSESMRHDAVVALLHNKRYLAAKYPAGEMEPSLQLIRSCRLDPHSETWRLGPSRANVSSAHVLSEFASWLRRTSAEAPPAVTAPGAERQDDPKSWPVFLLGCHRSGTTLLRYLLDAHPSLACPPESKFIAGLHAFYDYSQALEGLRSMGCSDADVLGNIRQLVTTVFEGYARRAGKVRWIDKTPNYYRILDFIDRVFEGRVLYICIYRHPLDTVASLEEMRDFATGTPEDPDIALAVKHYGRSRSGWAAYWRKVTGTLAGFCRQRPRRCLELRYESLVERPEAELGQVLDFIGERWVDGLVKAAFARRPASGYQDWKIRSAAGVHAESVGRWTQWSLDDAREAWSVARPVAAPLGYAGPPAADLIGGYAPSTQDCQGEVL